MKKNVIGSWQLSSFEIQTNAGKWEPWGSELKGLLILTPDSFMSVSILRNSNAVFDPIDDVLFYSGNFYVDGDQIIFDVLLATDSSRIGKKLKRTIKYNPGHIELSGKAASGKDFRLIWIQKKINLVTD